MCNHKVPCPAPDGTVVYRPCGRCLDCLRQYQQDWTCRLSEEFKAWQGGSVIFFTLTYSDPMLPVMVTYNHPINLFSYQILVRNNNVHNLSRRLSLLGLDSFRYTRSLRENTLSFRNDRKCLQDSYLDIPFYERPALFVPTVCYEDVNSWIRYCRKYFDRNVRSKPFRDKRVNPYLKSLTWKNIHGVESSFPNSAYTPSFKYWITSEYGPNTLRPHYHGVMFGVSEDMFRDVFAPWWRNHFGDGSLRSVKYSVFDPQKGGAMYIAKYCSKGSFDHPLVARSKHYPSGKEFISKHFINSLNWFGFDVPLCIPPFRLISKGIGVRYPFKADIQNYWDIQCDEFTKFVCKDKELRKVPFNFFDQIDVGLTTSVLDSGDNDIKSYSAIYGKRYCIEKIESRSRPNLLGLSDFVCDPMIGENDFLVFQEKYFNKKYIRSYVFKNKLEHYSCFLPRYYRRFLLSPFTQTAIKVVSRVRSNDDFDRERKFIRSLRYQDEKDAAICQKRVSENLCKCISQKEVAYRYSRFYSKPFLGDYV